MAKQYRYITVDGETSQQLDTGEVLTVEKNDTGKIAYIMVGESRIAVEPEHYIGTKENGDQIALSPEDLELCELIESEES